MPTRLYTLRPLPPHQKRDATKQDKYKIILYLFKSQNILTAIINAIT